ncbi:uncharacterized protein [Mobula birostris]|uniref:uncharacterized protein n=1 Tax=Mobula birostris TaxID=1983395 RepID=UPI003B2845FB
MVSTSGTGSGRDQGISALFTWTRPGTFAPFTWTQPELVGRWLSQTHGHGLTCGFPRHPVPEPASACDPRRRTETPISAETGGLCARSERTMQWGAGDYPERGRAGSPWAASLRGSIDHSDGWGSLRHRSELPLPGSDTLTCAAPRTADPQALWADANPKEIPLDMAQRRRVREMIQAMSACDGSWKQWEDTPRRYLQHLQRDVRNALSYIEPWRNSLREIEGHFGTGIRSYFSIHRFLIALNFCVSLLLFALVVTPVIIYTTKQSSDAVSPLDTPLPPGNCSRYDYRNPGLVSFYEIILDLLSGTVCHCKDSSSLHSLTLIPHDLREIVTECPGQTQGAKLFQYSYNTSIYPAMWKIAQVCPVHKKQDKSNPANYRPISLLSIIRKVMEGVTNSAITQHLLGNILLMDAQSGFHRGHSAPDLITSFVQAWTKELSTRGEVRVIALDIKAAFDRVWHQDKQILNPNSQFMTDPMHLSLLDPMRDLFKHLPKASVRISPAPTSPGFHSGEMIELEMVLKRFTRMLPGLRD